MKMEGKISDIHKKYSWSTCDKLDVREFNVQIDGRYVQWSMLWDLFLRAPAFFHQTFLFFIYFCLWHWVVEFWIDSSNGFKFKQLTLLELRLEKFVAGDSIY